MTAWLGRRSDVRVDYREPVRVIWPGEVSGIAARGVNLSTAGILVDAPTPAPVDVGAELLCDVALPRGSVLLRGRVAHRRLISSAKIGMGIEFVDLSPREAAELRDLVAAGQERPARVMVRFEGMNQVVRARAVATEGGLRLATTLPFVKEGAGLELSLGPSGLPTANATVAAVALDVAQADGIPRLLIDVRLDARADARPQAVPEQISHELGVLDEARVWEPAELAAVTEDVSEEPSGPPAFVAAPPLAVPSPLVAAPPLVAGRAPEWIAEEDKTQVVFDEPRRPRKLVALAVGMAVGALGLALFGPSVARLARRSSAPRAEAAAPAAPPSPAPVVVAPSAAPARVVEPVAPEPAAAVEAPSAAEPEPVAAEPAPARGAHRSSSSSAFTIGLEGSIEGADEYPVSAPDGVVFNLPRARPTIEMGTYETELPGVRSVLVRPLASGGTRVRVLFTKAHPAPKVTLTKTGITVTAVRGRR